MRGLSAAAGAAVAFWSALALLAYTYVGYPLLIWAWSRIRPRPGRRGPVEPTVSILISAYNEEKQIAARIQNLLDLDYPRDRREILVVSDGSGDATLERATAFEDAGVRVFGFPERRGKPAALNALAIRATGEVLVFTDARQRFERGTLRALVAGFGDPEVGGVGGELMLVADPERGSVGEALGLYWHYEKWIRRAESRVDSTVGATGAIYAVRRELFRPLPLDTLLDDVLEPMGVVAQGRRVVFESAARAYDRAARRAPWPGSSSSSPTIPGCCIPCATGCSSRPSPTRRCGCSPPSPSSPRSWPISRCSNPRSIGSAWPCSWPSMRRLSPATRGATAETARPCSRFLIWSVCSPGRPWSVSSASRAGARR
jgi:hypothetical protein